MTQQELVLGIYNHALVHRTDHVRSMLAGAGVPVMPGATPLQLNAEVVKQIKLGNNKVTQGTAAIVNQEIEKIKANQHPSKYSNFWGAIISALGSTGGSSTGSSTGGSSGGSAIGDAINTPLNLTSLIVNAITGMGDTSGADSANLQTIAAMQAAKQKAQTVMIISAITGLVILTSIGIYFITRKK